ncbi:hypothetical protein ACJJTC_009032 [Scirpophaga incertulas]
MDRRRRLLRHRCLLHGIIGTSGGSSSTDPLAVAGANAATSAPHAVAVNSIVQLTLPVQAPSAQTHQIKPEPNIMMSSQGQSCSDEICSDDEGPKRKYREMLTRRPSYRKILNDLGGAEIAVRYGILDNTRIRMQRFAENLYVVKSCSMETSQNACGTAVRCVCSILAMRRQTNPQFAIKRRRSPLDQGNVVIQNQTTCTIFHHQEGWYSPLPHSGIAPIPIPAADPKSLSALDTRGNGTD